MIQANELRIGNWFIPTMFNGVELEERPIIAMEFLALSENPNWGKPIPLTEERLLKFGFKKTENGWLRLEICNDWSYLYWERLAGFSLSVDKHGISLPYIKYVHQLQNLYFALTGEELILKE